MKGLTAMIVVAALSVPLAANQKDPQSEKISSIDSAGVKKLTSSERAAAIASLSPARVEEWKTLMPILTPAEQDEFLGLDESERDGWILRLHTRWGVSAKELSSRHRRAESVLGNLSEAGDAATLALLVGLPDRRTTLNCPPWTIPMEVWEWTDRKTAVLLYLTPEGPTAYLPAEEKRGRYGADDPRAVLLTEKGKSLGALPVFDGIPGEPAVIEKCGGAAAVTRALAADLELVEDLLERRTVERKSAASRVSAEEAAGTPIPASVTFPGKVGSRTSVEWTLEIPTDLLAHDDEDAAEGYGIEVAGTVARRGEPVDRFRYVYSFDSGDSIRASFERILAPDDYTYQIVAKEKRGTTFVSRGEIEVPYIPAAESPESGWDGQRNERIALYEQEYRAGETRVRLIPPGPGFLYGPQRFDTVVTGDDVAAVEFELDGKKVMTRRQPPYTLELNLGELPTMRKVRVTARDDSGRIIAGDEIVLNAGMVPFRVHIVSPRISEGVTGEVRAEVEVDVPQGKRLDRVELYLNDRHIASGFEPTFVQKVDLGPVPKIGYLRAKAVLADDFGTAAEDVVFLNAPHLIEQVDVRLVQLPVTVVRSGRLVRDLTVDDFSLREEGSPRSIEKFEYVRDLPLSIGLAVDISGSMTTRMNDVLRVAASFLDRVLERGDKAFVVAFNDRVEVTQPWTENLAGLNAGLSTLKAEDMTALYDALVASLYNFQGLEGQKALILLTDGADTASYFSLEQTLEFARRIRVPVYVIAVGFDPRDHKVRSVVKRISRETGGDSWFIKEVGDLSDIYDKIEEELRSQYVLGFYPSEEAINDGGFRRVEVKASEGKARTVAGYYP
ncbi:MAG: VWA domain-containing protein [Acidobacteria bacterium]|nr:VWA domain-containing protein [Acidobacteriota bacterium]